MQGFRVVVCGAMAVTLLTACGGGAETQDNFVPTPPPAPTPAPAPAPTPTSFTLSGTVSSPVDAAIDSDTADITTANGNNDDLASPQPIANPVTLGGHADLARDEFDLYSVRLAKDQRIDLAIAEDGLDNDLDLLLADRQGNVVAVSESVSNTESLTVPASGDYLIAVEAFDGRSNYVLTVRAPGTARAAAHGHRSQSPMIPGEMLVQIDPAQASTVQRLLVQAGMVAGTVVGERLQVWSLGPDTFWPATLARLGAVTGSFSPLFADLTTRARHDTLRAMKRVARLPGVVRVEPNFEVKALLTPSDPGFGDQWHYRLINLPQAWDVTTGSASVVVAVADTGVVLGHPDINGQLDPSDPDGFDFIASSNTALDGDGRDGNADDPGDDPRGQGSFHGTHVAGTVAAATNNGNGVAGAGFGSRIMPLRVLGRGGSGSSADILAAVRYAAGLNVNGVQAPRAPQILNLSLGCDDCYSAAEEEVYRDAFNRGLLIAAAAGNSGDSGNPVGFPASYAGVVSVGAVGPAVGGTQPRRAGYSQFNRFVDIAAPGGDPSLGSLRQTGILSTLAEGFAGTRRATYGYQVGTSMASPHVAGVMALMKAVAPTMTPTQFDQLLAAGELTTDLGAAGRDDQFGHGLIDAAKAVQAAARLANGGSVPERPSLVIQPEQLDFGNSTTSATLEARNGGSGNLTFNGVSDDAPWLTVNAGPAENGRILISASVNRAGLAEGAYSATITAQSSANTVTVPVLMRVGGSAAVGTAGVHYFLLVDTRNFEVVAGIRAEPLGGRYSLRFDNVPVGDYQLVGGTDSDQDDFICDGGEACAVYTTPDLPTTVSVRSANVSNLNFATSFDFATFASSQERGRARGPWRPSKLRWLPPQGLRITPAMKSQQRAAE